MVMLCYNQHMKPLKSLPAALHRGFTIVELAVVIVVIGILAGVVIVGYGTWNRSVAEATLKNDLQAVLGAMEDARTFENSYPSSLPSTYAPSDNVNIQRDSRSNAKRFCFTATSTTQSSLSFYIASNQSDPKTGSCSANWSPPVVSLPVPSAVQSAGSYSYPGGPTEFGAAHYGDTVAFGWNDPTTTGGQPIEAFRLRFDLVSPCSAQNDYVLEVARLNNGQSFSGSNYGLSRSSTGMYAISVSTPLGTCTVDAGLGAIYVSAKTVNGYGAERQYFVELQN